MKRCKRGHELTPANLYDNGKGYRTCAECKRATARAHSKRKRDAGIKDSRFDWLSEFKAFMGCKDCRESDPMVLQFHHRDPNSKLNTVSGLINLKASVDRVWEEIAKCDVLCANCHLRRHGGNFRLTGRKR